MKRLCFDTESDYFKPPTSAVGSIDYHRAYLRDKQLRFDCAVVYDEETGKYHEFNDQQANELVTMLAEADELISHSGTRVDLIVLEHVCGQDNIAPLFWISHHDLFDIHNWSSLDSLARQYLPGDRLAALQHDFDTRWKQVCTLTDHESFIAGKLAKARFDVERTYAVFMATLP